MWELSNERGQLTAVHSKGKSGMVLLVIGMIWVSVMWFMHAQSAELGIKNKLGKPALQRTSDVVLASIPGFLMLGVGFLMTGVETRLTLDEGKELFTYHYSYGFGSTRKDIPLDSVKGLQHVKVYVELRNDRGFRVGSRVDGALNLLTLSHGDIPLITDGRGELVAEGAKQLRDFFGFELFSASESRVEYVGKNAPPM